jgi:hypothetical protein
MSEHHTSLPPGFTSGWPPADPQAFVKQITDLWPTRPGHGQGKHWAVQVFGENPISGYRVIYKKADPND